jgi:hypothetical protein
VAHNTEVTLSESIDEELIRVVRARTFRRGQLLISSQPWFRFVATLEAIDRLNLTPDNLLKHPNGNIFYQILKVTGESDHVAACSTTVFQTAAPAKRNIS